MGDWYFSLLGTADESGLELNEQKIIADRLESGFEGLDGPEPASCQTFLSLATTCSFPLIKPFRSR